MPRLRNSLKNKLNQLNDVLFNSVLPISLFNSFQ